MSVVSVVRVVRGDMHGATGTSCIYQSICFVYAPLSTVYYARVDSDLMQECKAAVLPLQRVSSFS